ncbi:hypothetical protein JTE90_027809 [Oedothorax gibbosus]|uniref:Methylcytosine dioxygenase TET n=1 Tax=Oedothorax gibbosus TaxID=931172 RepID=A0AAV6V6H5_9ARAC|nr:hypothetical protein JTE90_027809 [Oedothorax gibbosus]
MSHQGYPHTYKNGPEYPPNMHPAGYMPRYPAYDAAQCQSFPFGKIHEGPVRPHNPNAFPIVRQYNSQHYNDGPKDGKDSFSRSKSPGHYNDVPKDMFPRNKLGNAYEPCKSPAPKDKNGKNGRDDPPSSPTDSKSDSETNDHTTTESCPDDTRSPASCDKQENSFFGDKSVSDSNSTDPHTKKLKNNVDSESIDDSQSFSSISNNNNNKKDGHQSFSEMRIQPPYGEYGMFPDGERRMIPPHQMSDNFGYRGQNHDKMDSENVFQVPSISSTTPPKVFPPVPPSPMSSESSSWAEDAKYYRHHNSSMSQDMDDGDKLPRKKRKRCGECPGCLQKQNCGRCGPCRSVRSHQICKMRKCESLKTKKEKNAGRYRRRNPEGGSLGAATHAAEESAIKCGRKRKDHDLLNAIREDRNSNSEIAPKMNGNPQSYLSQQDSLSPTNSSSMHMGSQSMRGQMDQYQPQGGNFHPQGMMNSYNSNSQYGSYTPQMPPNNSQMYDSRLSDGMAVDMDELNSTHRMTNTRLKTLIHNRQSQREQLIPISNNSLSHDSAYNSSTLSPIVGRTDYGSSMSPVGRYASPYLPPPGNHQDAMHNNMPYAGQSDASTSSLMHLQRLSPNNISPQKVQSSQRPPWSAEMSRKTPEGPMKSPVAAKPSLNGHGPSDRETPESKVVNGHDKPPDTNGVSDSSSDNSNVHNGVAKDHPAETEGKLERKTPVPEIKIPPLNDRSPLMPVNDRIPRPQMSPSLHPLPSPTDRVLQPLQQPNDHVLQPLQSPNDRVLQPLQSPNLHSMQVPAGSPRYHMPLNGPMTPPYGYRHFPPHHQVGLVANPPGCMPPPSSIPPMAPVANGETPSDEQQQPTPSSPFLLNTTTSMNTYTSITSTYSNSKLSFSNATCLPTFALTSVSNSSHTYAQSWEGNNSRFQMLPLGGGTAKSYIDSGRIHYRDSLVERTHPCQDFPFQDLPLQPPPSYPPFGGCPPLKFAPECAPVASTPDPDPQDRIEKLRTNTKLDPPQCDCLKNKEVLPSEKLPYYTHLGSGSSVSAIRELMECRSGEKGNAIRIEKLLYSGKEGKTSQGCPLAKWIIRRSGPEEKLLTVVRHRPGHTCPTAYIVIAMVAWEGVQESVADVLYRTVTYKTVNFGIPTQRKCGTNEMRTCACQGLDPETCGASFSFGCSWSMYYNGCKFARSKNARKFKLTEKDEEKELEDRLQTLASDVSSLYEKIAPESFYNQTEFEQQASDCRLGVRKGRPFSGVTACLDYCAHSHKDLQNMNNGCTVVVTLNKHKGWEKPEDEQLHVLPLYVMDNTDEYGSKEGQEKKITAGSVEKLDKYPVDYRIRTTPLKPCKTRGRKPKDGFSPRKQALQAAFKQLIASGKLRRIDPPDLYQRHCRALTNSIQPDSSADNNRLHNPQVVGGSFNREDTSCKFFAGKHVSHSPYGAQSWGNQSLNDNNPTSVGGNNPICSYPNSSFPKYEQGVCPQNSSLTNTCSKMTSGTYVTSSCNAPTYNDSNNNFMPSYASQPQGYRPHNTQTTYSNYNPGMNPLPPSYGSQHNSVDPYHYSYSHNGPHFENNAFHGHYGYGYPPPNVALKIPGNYSASSYNYQGPQQSGNLNCQNISYSNSHMTQNNNFCNYAMPKPQAPASFSTADPPSNYQGFYPEQQTTQFSSPNSNTSRVSTPHFQNSPCSGNQSVFVKSENANESFAEKTPPENPDSVYTMTDLDSKSVNCFSTSKQSNAPEKAQIKKEDQMPKFYENQNQKSVPNYGCDNDSQNKAMSNYRCDNYYQGAKNYNYHLQQSNMVLDFDNFNDIVCNNYETTTEYGHFKEGYEKGVYESNDPVPNNNNNNKDLVSMTKMTESPYPFQQKPNNTDPLNALTTKYNMEEDENFIDSTTLEGDEVYEGHSDNESSFKDTEVGGVAIALTHGSVLFECAKHELHATTPVKNPNRRNPTRISLVFYQHKHLNFESHGEAEWGQKMKEKRVGNAAKVCFEEAPTIKRQCFEGEEPGKIVTGFAGTTPTTSWVTVFSIAPLTVGSPYRP